MAREHINEHRVVHDYGLCAVVKAAQIGDLNARANLVSKLVACHQHQRELVQYHKMCLPDLRFLWLYAQGVSLKSWGNLFQFTVAVLCSNVLSLASELNIRDGIIKSLFCCWTSWSVLVPIMVWHMLGAESLPSHPSAMSIKVQTFSSNKMHLKMSHAKWRPFCSGIVSWSVMST